MEEIGFVEFSEEGAISPISVSVSASQELITSSYEEIDSGVESYSIKKKESTETVEEKKPPEQEIVEKEIGNLKMMEMIHRFMKQLDNKLDENNKQLNENRLENIEQNKHLNQRLDENNKQLNENNKQLNQRLDENNKQLNQRLDENDKHLKEQFEQTNKKLEKLEDRIDGFELKIKEVEVSLKQEFENQLKLNKIEIERRCDESKAAVHAMVDENKQEIIAVKTEMEKQEDRLNNSIQNVEIIHKDRYEKLELLVMQKQETINDNQHKIEESLKNNNQNLEKCYQQIEQNKRESKSTVDSFTNECRGRIEAVESKINYVMEVKEQEYIKLKDDVMKNVAYNWQRYEDKGVKEEVRRKDEELIGQRSDEIVSQYSQVAKEANKSLEMYENTEVKRIGSDREVGGPERQESRQFQKAEEKYNNRDSMHKTGDPILTNLIKIKIFSGNGNENPVEYLRTLEELFSLHSYKEQEKLAIACNYLSDHAKDWWRILFEKPATFEEFKSSVLSSFWNESRQDQIRYQVMHEKYQMGKGSYTQFFRNQAVKLRSLSAFAMTENQILMLLRHNFPRAVEQVLIASGCTKLKDAADILNALEMSGVNETRERLWKDKPGYQVSNIHVRPKGNISSSRDQIYNVERYGYRNEGRTDRKGRSQSRKKSSFNESQPTTSGVTTIYKNGGVNSKNTKELN